MRESVAYALPLVPDRSSVQRKYDLERAKRLRSDGLKQYLRMEGRLSSLSDDRFTQSSPRPARKDHVTFAFIGGGFAGLTTCAHLKMADIGDVRIIDRAGDFGGVWYWNRYPGAQCDTASMVYLPLLEETGTVPSEKYAHAPEVFRHCQRIGERFQLYENALFHTAVTDLTWDEEHSLWRIRTDRGDAFTARFVGLGIGELHVGKLPGIPGIETFKGRAFHTSRWDYAYTGGDAHGAPLRGLADKRVGLIGTGATAVQCVSHLANFAKELFVFQRTPAAVYARENEPIDPEWFARISVPGWQDKWLMNFTATRSGLHVGEDLVRDGWTAFARRLYEKLRTTPSERWTPELIKRAEDDADFEYMETIRARVETTVRKNGATAERLKPWYGQFCKRPCFHDDYLEAFNSPNTHLIDTDGRGVDRTTEGGIVVADTYYPLDCIIYASGFESGTPYCERAGFDVVGRGAVRLSDRWADGVLSLHGIHVHGFPNLFVVDPLQGANLLSNITHNIVDSARTIAGIVRHALDIKSKEVEVTSKAESDWANMLLKDGRKLGSSACTPGKYNYEGSDIGRAALLNVGYPAGPLAFFRYIDRWRKSGRYDGLVFR